MKKIIILSLVLLGFTFVKSQNVERSQAQNDSIFYFALCDSLFWHEVYYENKVSPLTFLQMRAFISREKYETLACKDFLKKFQPSFVNPMLGIIEIIETEPKEKRLNDSFVSIYLMIKKS